MRKEEELKSVVDLIINERGSYNIEIDENTSLQKDLKIYGDDAVEFIVKFGESFNVDVSKFNLTEYFSPEGFGVIRKRAIKEFTIQNLLVAMKKGRLE